MCKIINFNKSGISHDKSTPAMNVFDIVYRSDNLTMITISHVWVVNCTNQIFPWQASQRYFTTTQRTFFLQIHVWNQMTHELCNEKVNKNEIPGMGNLITCRLLCRYELLGTSALLLEQIRAVAGQRARLLLTFVKHKVKPDQ